MVVALMTDKEKSIQLLVRLCSNKAAFEARPQRRMSFEMDKVRRLFEAAENYGILVHTPYIIILKSKPDKEITFSEDGRMLLKRVSSEEEARALAYDVFEVALEASKLR